MKKWKLIVKCANIHTEKLLRGYIENMRFSENIEYNRLTTRDGNINIYGVESDLDIIDNKISNALYMYSDLKAEILWEEV